MAAVGTGVQVMGSMKANEAQKEISALERRAEAERRKSMELQARRQKMEMVRNVQRARAMALTVATSQGAAAPGSSALGGAFGQFQGQTGVNMLGVNQNLEIGRNTFDINSLISDQRMALADAGTMSSIGQGLSSLGGSIFGSIPAFGNLAQGFNPSALLGASGSAYNNPNKTGSFY